MVVQMQAKPQQQLRFFDDITLEHFHLNGNEPKWLTDLRKVSWQQFKTLGFPTKNQEAWRFTDLGSFLKQTYLPFQAPAVLEEAPIKPYFYPEAEQTRLVFVNGIFSAALSSVHKLPQGVVVSDLQTVLNDQPEQLQPWLTQALSQEDNSFLALNTALFTDGAFVFVPAQVVLESPVQLVFLTHHKEQEPRMAYPRSLIVLEEGAQLTLSSSFVGLPESTSYFNNAVMDILVGQDAKLDYTYLQAESGNALQILNTRLSLQDKAEARVISASLGSQLTRHELSVDLKGQSASCSLNGVAVLNGTTQFHDHIVMAHEQPNSNSEQLYKSILNGQSKSEFDGIIVIHEGAVQTDASQLNRNLLLSDDARAYTRPQLRIDVDDVKCSHGATVGQLQEDEIFYLESRGISSQTAQQILTFAFAEEIVEKIKVPTLRKQLSRLILEALSQNTEVSLTKELL